MARKIWNNYLKYIQHIFYLKIQFIYSKKNSEINFN